MPNKTLSQLALPMVISFTVRFLFTIVDTVYAAEIKDEEPAAVAAIGLFIPVQVIFIALWVGLSAGFTASISQAFGAKDEPRVKLLKHAMRRILVALAPVCWLTAAAIWLIVPSLELGASLEESFLTYSLILVIGMPLAGFLSIYPDSIVKAHHDTVSTMIAGVSSTITNVVLNTVFVFAFGWGLAGIAVATLLSRYAGFAYAVRRTRALERERLAEEWPPTQPGNTPQRGPTAAILTLAIPGGLAYLLLLLEELLVAKLLTALPDKEIVLASYGVYNRLLSLAIMPASATAVALLPYVARLIPEGRIGDILRDLPRALGQALLLGLILAIPTGWIFAESLAGYFISDGRGFANAEEAKGHATSYLRLLPLAALCVIPYLMFRPVFEAANRAKLGSRLVVFKTLALALPLILAGRFLGPKLGMDPMMGLLSGMIASTVLASAMAVVFGRAVLREACREQSARPKEPQGAQR